MTLATDFPTSNTAGVDTTAVYTASTSGTWGENVQPGAPFAAGTVITGSNGGKYVYVKLGTGGCTGQGYFLVAPLNAYDGAVMMSNSVGNLGDPCGVALCTAAAVAGDFVWMQTSGLCSGGVRVAASCVHNVALASTANTSNGVLDDAVGTGTKNISGIVITTTVTGAGLSPAELNNPVVGSTN